VLVVVPVEERLAKRTGTRDATEAVGKVRPVLHRRTFPSLDHLVKAIIEYLDHCNRDPKPFGWTASVDSVLAKLRSCMPIY